MLDYIKPILDLLPAIAIFILAIYASKRDKKIKELEKRLEKLEGAECLNEIERQINQLKEN